MLSALNSKYKPSGSHTFITSRLNSRMYVQLSIRCRQSSHRQWTSDWKTYRVKANQSSVSSTVISSSAYISIEKTNDFQYNHYFKLANSIFKPIQETLSESIFYSFEQNNDLFQQTWNQLLSEQLALIIGSQEINADNEMQDDLDGLVEKKNKAAHFQMCPTCKQ